MHAPTLSLRETLPVLAHWYLPMRGGLPGPDPFGTLQICEHTEGTQGFQFRERFLHILWNEQRLGIDLRTDDGRRLDVVSPGIWNVEAGPDFRQAVLRFDGEIVRGDVEVHRTPADWQRHGHDGDPNYDDVVLHVVWEDSPGARPALPHLALADSLDGAWRDLFAELQADLYPEAKRIAPGRCALQWASTEDERIVRLLGVAGLARFEDKTLRLQRRAAAVGEEQALYEELFGALGYKANRDAFRALARNVPLTALRSISDPVAREALLFGTAGLLPDPSVVTVRPPWQDKLRILWDLWWRFDREQIPIGWSRTSLRPTNSPERRLSAGILFMEHCQWQPLTFLLERAAIAQHAKELLNSFHDALGLRSPWEGAVDFCRPLRRPARLLGQARIRDIVVNVLLPALHAGGLQRRDERLSTLARETYLATPKLQDNRLLKEAAHRFFVPPSRAKSVLKKAVAQQGLLEIYRTFCLALGVDCENCPFTTPDSL
jgi:hypothetical protein